MGQEKQEDSRRKDADDDVDGIPLEDVDGVPLDEDTDCSPDSGVKRRMKFKPSKWETVD